MEEKKSGRLKELLSWVLTIAFAIAAAWVINNFVLFKMFVDGPCMESTLYYADEMYGLRIAYLFSEPKRGDIVTFWAPDLLEKGEKVVYIKRIIGLPGETVEIKDGVVYIDGEILEEEYKQNLLAEEYKKQPELGNHGPYEVSEDSYFMLGDNRDFSHDSVDWENTYVKKENILSKAMFRYSPNFHWFSDVKYE